jgi:uncharacterized protein YdeI (YjbR/CyaY-like superfamily)
VSEREILRLPDAEAWHAWLVEHHESSPGVRLVLAKKGASGVTYAEALEVSLCFGWIDGRVNTLDETHFLRGFSPRGLRSIWSTINRQSAVRLIDEGRMQPAGLREVERAKADGRWDAAYEGQKKATVPDDLAAALAASPGASRFFATLTSQNRYAILFRIQNVKRAETRARKIAEYVAMLERGETIYPQRPRD